MHCRDEEIVNYLDVKSELRLEWGLTFSCSFTSSSLRCDGSIPRRQEAHKLMLQKYVLCLSGVPSNMDFPTKSWSWADGQGETHTREWYVIYRLVKTPQKYHALSAPEKNFEFESRAVAKWARGEINKWESSSLGLVRDGWDLVHRGSNPGRSEPKFVLWWSFGLFRKCRLFLVFRLVFQDTVDNDMDCSVPYRIWGPISWLKVGISSYHLHIPEVPCLSRAMLVW